MEQAEVEGKGPLLFGLLESQVVDEFFEVGFDASGRLARNLQ